MIAARDVKQKFYCFGIADVRVVSLICTLKLARTVKTWGYKSQFNEKGGAVFAPPFSGRIKN